MRFPTAPMRADPRHACLSLPVAASPCLALPCLVCRAAGALPVPSMPPDPYLPFRSNAFHALPFLTHLPHRSMPCLAIRSTPRTPSPTSPSLPRLAALPNPRCPTQACRSFPIQPAAFQPRPSSPHLPSRSLRRPTAACLPTRACLPGPFDTLPRRSLPTGHADPHQSPPPLSKPAVGTAAGEFQPPAAARDHHAQGIKARRILLHPYRALHW